MRGLRRDPSDKRAAEALERIKANHAETEMFLAVRGKLPPVCHYDRGWLLTERERLLSALREAEKAIDAMVAKVHINCEPAAPCGKESTCEDVKKIAVPALAAIRKAMEGEPDPEKRPQEPRR